MQRSAVSQSRRWDDPLFMVSRLLVDIFKGRRAGLHVDEADIMLALRASQTPAAMAAVELLTGHPQLLEGVAEYLANRSAMREHAFSLFRTEAQAIEDFHRIVRPGSPIVIANYGVKLTEYHKSAKALVATVAELTEQARGMTPADAIISDRAATLTADGRLWVSPRRCDGALPGLINPVALWEIKEYWGTTGGGSKMSDAIYECQLFGLELRLFEDLTGIHVRHYLILDGLEQWLSRPSDVARAIDLLEAGLLDELIVGREVLTRWPEVIRECAAEVRTAA